MAGMSLISALPIVGTILALTLLPTFSLIMMVAAAEVWSNRVPTPVLIWHILRQGKERLAALATLGACYAVGFGLVMFLSSLVDGGEFARVYLGLAPLSQELAQSASFQAAMWTACLLYLPLSFLFLARPGVGALAQPAGVQSHVFQHRGLHPQYRGFFHVWRGVGDAVFTGGSGAHLGHRPALVGCRAYRHGTH